MGSVSLPKRNFGFEKRQKELNKQRKKEEKKQRKLDRGNLSSEETPNEGAASEDVGLEPNQRESPDGL
jgi:hypothetical protein